MGFASNISAQPPQGVQYNGLTARGVPNTWLDPSEWTTRNACLWPTPALRTVPRLDLAARVAELVVAVNRGERDPLRLSYELGIRVTVRELSAVTGGLEAALVPDFGHTFEVICDPSSREDSTSPIRFRVAHEIAHTLFYDWTEEPPRRTGPGGAAEEAFCDAFAAALTGEQSPT